MTYYKQKKHGRTSSLTKNV